MKVREFIGVGAKYMELDIYDTLTNKMLHEGDMKDVPFELLDRTISYFSVTNELGIMIELD